MMNQPELYAEAVAIAQGRLPISKATPDHFEAVFLVLKACRASHLELQQTFDLLCQSDFLDPTWEMRES